MAAVSGSHSLFCTDNTLISAKQEPSLFLGKQRGIRCPSINKGVPKQKYCMVTKAARSSEKHLNSLNSYLGKLQDDIKKPSSKSLNDRTESIGDIDERKAENGLRSLESYLDKAKDVESENYMDKDIFASIRERSMNSYMELKPENAERKEISDDEASDFYLIGALASINIAVFLFELATPVKSSYFELVSLPMVYGAKINDLILTGEWWRLLTPMFLVQD